LLAIDNDTPGEHRFMHRQTPSHRRWRARKRPKADYRTDRGCR